MKYFIVLFSILHVICCKQSAQSHDTDLPTITNVSVEEFDQLIKDHPEYLLIDARTPEEVAEGKIGNAQTVDYLGEFFDRQVEQLDTTKTILLYCRSGKRSSKAAEVMIEKGFDKIYNLNGGYLAWTEGKN